MKKLDYVKLSGFRECDDAVLVLIPLIADHRSNTVLCWQLHRIQLPKNILVDFPHFDLLIQSTSHKDVAVERIILCWV